MDAGVVYTCQACKLHTNSVSDTDNCTQTCLSRAKCEFYECGPCSGPVVPRENIKWSSINDEALVSSMRPVMICGSHLTKLSVQYGDGKGGLPPIRGYTEAYAFDELINMLENTGTKTGCKCLYCGFPKIDFLHETQKAAACSLDCASLFKHKLHMFHCTYREEYREEEEVVCVCDRYPSNTNLHWSIGSWFGLYDCYACERQSSRDIHLALPIETIVSMAKETPMYLNTPNSSDKTPIGLIDFILDNLMNSTANHKECSNQGACAKNRKNEWDRHNIGCLTKLKKALTEVLLNYNKSFEEWEKDLPYLRL